MRLCIVVLVQAAMKLLSVVVVVKLNYLTKRVCCSQLRIFRTVSYSVKSFAVLLLIFTVNYGASLTKKITDVC